MVVRAAADGEATGVDKELLDESFGRLGAVIGGRRTYEAAAGPKDVGIMGADVIRQALAGGHLNELVVSIAPVVLGSGKRLFEGSTGPSGSSNSARAVTVGDAPAVSRGARVTA